MYSQIDFSLGSNFYLNLYCLLLYCFLVIISWEGNVSGYYNSSKSGGRTIILSLGLLLFAMTCFVNDDFFHYQELMYEYRGNVNPEDIRIELFYQYLISFIDGSYELFRLFIWGTSLLLIIWATRLFKANVYHTLFMILAGYIIVYSYARATLAMSIFSLGAVVLCMSREQRSRWLNIIGGAILASSIYFHRSMAPVVILALCSTLLPYKQKIAKTALWWFPVVVAVCYSVADAVFGELLEMANAWNGDDSGALDKMEFYVSERDQAEATTANGYVTLTLKYATFYLPFFFITTLLRSDDVRSSLNQLCIKIYLIIYFVFALATALIFVEGGDVLFYRYLYVSFILLSILIAYMRDMGVLKGGQYAAIIICFILSSFAQLFVAVYTQS